MKKIFPGIILGLGCVNVLLAELTPSAKEAFDSTYSTGIMSMDQANVALDKIKHADFEKEAHRILALLQVKSSTENPEMLKDARKLAESFIESAPDGWEKDMVRITLSSILTLEGQSKAGCDLAEKVLNGTDFSEFSKANDSYISYIANRYNTSQIGIDKFLMDGLRRQIGSYYLNRSHEEGSPDIQKAYEVFTSIIAKETKASCLSDARFRELTVSHSGIDKLKTEVRQDDNKSGNKSNVLAATNDKPTYKAEFPNQSVQEKHSLNKEALLFKPWCIWSVAAVAIIGILALIFNKRRYS
jgi:hypothetical protein